MMNPKISISRLSIILLFLTGCLWAQKDLDKEITYKSEELEKIRREISQYRAELEQAKSRERSILQQLNTTEKEISLTNKLINQLNREQQKMERQIHQTRQSIDRLSRNLKTIKENFSRRLVYIYKQGDYSDWELLLTSRSINQAIYRYKYLRIIADLDRRHVSDIRHNITAIDNRKQRLISELNDQENILQEKQRYQLVLNGQKKQRNRQLATARQNRDNIVTQIREKEEAARELAGLIGRLERERDQRRKELERQRRLAGMKETNPFLASQGQLSWPVNGQIISKFGTHKHPVLNTITENSGIDIKVRRGTPVRAILDGVVTTITYIRGFGNTIIIDHGSGFYTVYSHVENVTVFEKEYVTRNTIIAEVGDTGTLSGAMLHFEIWSNRNKLNPEEWLARRS